MLSSRYSYRSATGPLELCVPVFPSKFLRGTILHLSSQAHLKGEERMTLSEVIAFLEVQPIEKSWKQLIGSEAGDEGIRRIAAEAGELMLNSPGQLQEQY
jgi:hypothetical protein